MDPLSVASDVTCSVCLDMLTDPRVLTCMHSFCSKCLTSIHIKASQDSLFGAVGGPDVIKCPDCRKETILDRKKVAGLPKNFALASIAEKLKANLASTDKKIVLCSICDPEKKPATKTCTDCSGNVYCQECFLLYHPMKGVFKSHQVLDIGHEDETAQITKVKNLPSCSETAKVAVEWSPVSGSDKYSIKISMEDLKDNMVKHEIQIDVAEGTQSLIVEGLRHDCSYTIYLLKKQDIITTCMSIRQFHTAKYLDWLPDHWYTDDSHQDISVSCNLLTACPEQHKDEFIDGDTALSRSQWRRVIGVASKVFYDAGYLDGLYYWQTSVELITKGRLADGNIVLNLGMCKVDKEDNFSPLSGHRDCYCVKFYKLPGRPHIGLALWDGEKRSTVSVDFSFHVKSKRIHKIGFFLDCEKHELKIIRVNTNTVIGKFTDIGNHEFSPICEFLNINKVQACVDLEEPNVYQLPHILFD